MNQEQKMVLAFHRRFGVIEQDKPNVPDGKTAKLRIALIEEEFNELREATEQKDLVLIADALADLLYVTYGTAVSYGIDMEPIFQEVHASNMSKGNPQVLRAPNGKIMKADGFIPPRLARILKEQMGSIPSTSSRVR